jgi:Carboxypeptidase regulatory-like domain
MTARLLRPWLIALLVAASVSPSFSQRQTGTISGRILDKDGKPLSGATVTISGPAQMGFSSYVTRETGFFRFAGLEPGEYDLRAEMPGFKSYILPDVVANVGRTTRLVIRFEETSVEEEVTLRVVSPVVDVESAKFSVNYSARFLAGLPLNRDLYDIQNSVPGAVSEGDPYLRTSSILGGTVRSQVYAFEGMRLNDPTTSLALTNINFDVYEEIEFELGGLPAEVGPTDPVYINIVSKGGANGFTGGLSGYFTGSGLAKDLIPKSDTDAYRVDPPGKFASYSDLSFHLAGAFLPDRAWYYLNGRYNSWRETTSIAPEARMAELGFYGIDYAHYDYDHDEWFGFAKLNIQFDKNIRYTGVLHYNNIYEPVYQRTGGADISLPATDVWSHEHDFTTTHLVNWSLDQDTFVDAQATYVNRRFPVRSRTQDQPTYYDYKQDVYWGASAYNDDQTRKRIGISAAITRFQGNLLSVSHEFKAGAEFEQSEQRRDWYRKNPYYSYWEDYAAGNPYYYSTDLKQGRLRIYNCPPTAEYWSIQDDLRRFSGYVQDNLTKGRLTLNLGLRADYSYLFRPQQSRPTLAYSYGPPQLNPAITESGSLLDALISQWHSEIGAVSPFDTLTTANLTVVHFFTLSPRLGLVYDPFGRGKTALKMSFSRYTEPLWADKYSAGQIFNPGSVDYYWNDLNGNMLMDLPPTDSYVLQSYPSQDPSITFYSQDLKAPYITEFLAGIEQEVFQDFKLGLQYIWKKSRNIVETVDVNNGYDPEAKDESGLIWIPFQFTDPGWDGQWGTSDDQTLTAYGLRADRPVPTWMVVNPPEAERKYWALAMTFDKRMSHNWQLSGSILYSSFKGNVDATTDQTEGTSGVFHSPNSLVNAYGPLSFDRPWQFKVMGTYVLPFQIMISAYLRHESGIPWTRTISRVYFPADFPAVQQTFVSLNAEAPGSRRRPAYTNLDLRLEKGFPLKATGSARLDFYLDIFNVTGSKGIVGNEDPSPRLRFDQTPPVCEVSPTYGSVLSVYGVRSYRIGIRWSF